MKKILLFLLVLSCLSVNAQKRIIGANNVVTILAGSGMAVNNRWGGSKTSGQWAKAGLEVRATGSSVLSGDVQ